MFSLIIPVYKNEDTISELLEALHELDIDLNNDLEVTFVVDGSPDNSYGRLKELLPTTGISARIVRLSRNFGSFAAIRMGLALASGPLFAVMAADLQEPPELIRDMFTALRDDPVDIVLGQREGRSDPLPTRLQSKLFWGLYRRLVCQDVPPGGIDVFACNQNARDALLSLDETHSSLVIQLLWIGFRRKTVRYRRRQRRGHGTSAWSLRKRVRYMLDSIFSFTALPVTLLLVVGMIGSSMSVLVAAVVFISWLLGLITVTGYTPIALLITSSLFLQLFSLGIIGSYVYRTYENSKRRPNHIPFSVECINHDSEAARSSHPSHSAMRNHVGW